MTLPARPAASAGTGRPRVAPRAAAVLPAGLAAVVLLGGCSTVDHTSTQPTSEPFPVDSSSASSAGPDLQLRQVLDVAGAQAGQCPTPAPATPEPRAQATLCSADTTLVYTLAAAAVDGAEVTGVEATYSSARPVVRITVSPQGGAGLVRVTSQALVASPPSNQVALVSHGRVQTALPVTDSIDGQVLEITGFDSLTAAQQAADLLTS